MQNMKEEEAEEKQENKAHQTNGKKERLCFRRIFFFFVVWLMSRSDPKRYVKCVKRDGHKKNTRKKMLMS